MFRRTKSEPAETATDPAARPAARDAPRPSRREAEAAARARAKVPRTRKEQAAGPALRPLGVEPQVRAAMKAGDERYYLPRDQGPVRRFIRDFVDCRFSFIELMIPLLVVTMVLGYSGNEQAALDRQHRAARHDPARDRRHGVPALPAAPPARRPLPGREPPRAPTYYAVTRALQMKFMRLPKAKVKIGQELPEHYR